MEQVSLDPSEVRLLNEADKDIQIAVSRKKYILELIYRTRSLNGEYGLSPDNTLFVKAASVELEG